MKKAYYTFSPLHTCPNMGYIYSLAKVKSLNILCSAVYGAQFPRASRVSAVSTRDKSIKNVLLFKCNKTKRLESEATVSPRGKILIRMSGCRSALI